MPGAARTTKVAHEIGGDATTVDELSTMLSVSKLRCAKEAKTTVGTVNVEIWLFRWGSLSREDTGDHDDPLEYLTCVMATTGANRVKRQSPRDC